MKAFLRILILLQIVLLFIGCSSKEISPLLYKDEIDPISSDKNIDKLNYTIDKITLSKSYQSIEPNIELLKSGLDSKILLSLGLVDSSGVTVDQINREGRDVKIYIQNQKNYNTKELVVPQVIIEFEDLSPNDLEDLNFKIVNKNYESIETNIDIGEAISKIKSSLNIATSTFPSSNIKEEDGKMILDLGFTNVVDLKDNKNPIIDLLVSIDLTNGEIIKSDKSSVSSLIDEGCILDYIPNKYLFYVKEVVDKDDISYDLWMYDIKKDSRKKIYNSNYQISSLKFNSNYDKAFLIESSDEYNKLSILNLENLKVSKANLDDKINLSSAFWRDEDIFIKEKDNKSTKFYSLNTLNNNFDFVISVDKDIKQVKYLNDTFLFTIEDDKAKEIYLTKDFKDNELIDRGENPLFINENTIAYLKNDTSTDKNIIWFYCSNGESIEPYPGIDVKDYFLWKDNLAIIQKTPIGSENPLYIYDLKDEDTEFITSVKSDKIFLNTDENILYINSSIDLKDSKTSVISYLNLEDHKAPKELN